MQKRAGYIDNSEGRVQVTETYIIRPAAPGDIEAILEVFNYYVENSFAAYHETTVGPEFFQTLEYEAGEYDQKYPFYVIEEKGRVVGIGALRLYLPFPNFRQTGVISYFLLPGHTRKGIGTRLLARLCQDARDKKMKTLLANVSSKNEASLNFHRKNGFMECGRFKEVGIKFGEYFDIVWMQKFLEESREGEALD